MPRRPGRPVGSPMKAQLLELPIIVAKEVSKQDTSLPLVRPVKVAGRWKGTRARTVDESLPVLQGKMIERDKATLDDFNQILAAHKDSTPLK